MMTVRQLVKMLDLVHKKKKITELRRNLNVGSISVPDVGSRLMTQRCVPRWN